ncbi:MAG: carboxylesterase family protein [Actinomycetia bacterium]|nr:carboxylesterase family protein [Actinomycetes bacterium]
MSGSLTGWQKRVRRGVGILAAMVLILGVTAMSASGGEERNHDRPGRGPVVATDTGPVRGLATKGTESYLGIPYAAPPEGHLRWRPPQPATRWHGVRDATRYAPHCAQGESAFGTASTSEDCLYLNVFGPAHRGRRHQLPVIVWFHGGSLARGESDGFDPTGLVRNGVIVVTVNYRLGALGFMATPGLAAEQGGHAGNYGILDQQAALRWVQRNVGGFGGDPSNVTIAGESAGGLSVLTHLASPLSHGLFHKAIVQSGTYARTQAPQATAEQAGERFAAAVGCADQGIACLRRLPVSKVLANQRTGYVPNIDGRVLTQTLDSAFAAGEFNRVPVLNGTNHDEWRLIVAILHVLAGNPVTADNYSSQFGVPDATAEAIVARYPLGDYASPALALGSVGTDRVYACTALSTNTMLSKYVPTYAYEFNDPQAPQVFLPPAGGFPYGAAHASELQYLFNLNNVDHPTTLNPAQQRLASAMRAYWTNFAKRGSPNGSGTPSWPRFDDTTGAVQSLVPSGPRTETDFAAEHKCDFWSSPTG